MIPGAVVLLAVSLVTQIFPADDDSRFPVPSAVSLVETQIFPSDDDPRCCRAVFQFSVFSLVRVQYLGITVLLYLDSCGHYSIIYLYLSFFPTLITTRVLFMTEVWVNLFVVHAGRAWP